MSFNEEYYRERLIPLLNSCIREMRHFDCESEPTDNYGYNVRLFDSINLTYFRQLHDIISDMVYDNDIIEVADVNAAANVFLLMSALSDKGLIDNKGDESEPEYDENGIEYARKEKICYPLMALLFADKCDYYMLGSRLIPRIFIGGEADLKACFTKWANRFKRLNFPDGVSVDTFYDTLYIAWVPSPESMESLTKPFIRKHSSDFNFKLNQLGGDYRTSSDKGRGQYFKWVKNNSKLEFEIGVDRSLGMW